MMKAIYFRLSGRLAHYLKAEAGVNALSYPVPTRTVLLGIIGAILGLEKDTPQSVLEPAFIAIHGKMPLRHWHRAKLRKDPPGSLPMIVERKQSIKASTVPEEATLILQEWLVNPCYEVWVIIPEPYHSQFLERVKSRKWYFQPSLGLSEMMANIEYLGADEPEEVYHLPFGVYEVGTILRQNQVQIDFKKSLANNLNIQILQMPRTVTSERVFTHEKYLWECQGNSLTVETSEAYKIGDKVVMFL